MAAGWWGGYGRRGRGAEGEVGAHGCDQEAVGAGPVEAVGHGEVGCGAAGTGRGVLDELGGLMVERHEGDEVG